MDRQTKYVEDHKPLSRLCECNQKSVNKLRQYCKLTQIAIHMFSNLLMLIQKHCPTPEGKGRVNGKRDISDV